MVVDVKKHFAAVVLLLSLFIQVQAADTTATSKLEPTLQLNDFKVYGTKEFNLSLHQELSTAFKNSAYYRLLGWADSNTLILLVSGKETKGDIFTLNLTTKQLKKLTRINKEIERAAVAPNGENVALITLHKNRRALGVLNLKSGHFTPHPFNNRKLSRSMIWHADSTKVGFYSIAKILSYSEGDRPQKETLKKTLHIYDVQTQSYKAFDNIDNRIHFTSFCQSEPCVYVKYEQPGGKRVYKRFYYPNGEYADTRWEEPATSTMRLLTALGAADSYAYVNRNPNEQYTLTLEHKGKPSTYCPGIAGWFVFLNYNKNGNGLTAVVDNKGRFSAIYLDLESRRCQSISDPNFNRYKGVFPAPDGKRIAYNLSGPGYRNTIYTQHIGSSKRQLIKATEVLGEPANTTIVTKAFTYPTFDKDDSGKTRQIPAYWIEDKSTNKAKKPVFVYIHGGPPSKYTPHFRYSTYIAIKRYGAILVAPNIRGSSGYGAAYLSMDNKEKRIDSIKDADYLVKYLLKQDVVDTAKIFLIGASYGAVPAYWAAFQNQQHIAGVIDFAGVKDLTSVYHKKSHDTSLLLQTEYGDRHDPKLTAVLKQVSPYRYAEDLTIPIFISHNENDHHVPIDDSHQFYQLVSQRNKNIIFLSDHSGGHSFESKESLYKLYTYYFDWLDKLMASNTTD